MRHDQCGHSADTLSCACSDVQVAMLPALALVAAMQPINSIVFVGDGAFQGAKDFQYLAVSTGFASAVAAGYMLSSDASLPSVWQSLLLLQVLRAATLLARFSGKVQAFGGSRL
jgi:Na+-driven multidrug efflux pump